MLHGTHVLTDVEKTKIKVPDNGTQMAGNLHLKFNVKGQQMALDLERNDHVTQNVTVLLGDRGSFKAYMQDMVFN